jgi:RTX calcium-binding nonapeptide repeat (4 copies)
MATTKSVTYTHAHKSQQTPEADTYGGSNKNDFWRGGNGDDTAWGNAGSDALYGGNGDDKLYGGSGKDKLYGEDGNDDMDGGSDNDHLYGGNGDDEMKGANQNDSLWGGKGDDTLWGGKGDDKLYGEEGNDEIYGDTGNDDLDGGKGNDHLYGGEGTNTLNGGQGQDTYHLTPAQLASSAILTPAQLASSAQLPHNQYNVDTLVIGAGDSSMSYGIGDISLDNFILSCDRVEGFDSYDKLDLPGAGVVPNMTINTPFDTAHFDNMAIKDGILTLYKGDVPVNVDSYLLANEAGKFMINNFLSNALTSGSTDMYDRAFGFNLTIGTENHTLVIECDSNTNSLIMVDLVGGVTELTNSQII